MACAACLFVGIILAMSQSLKTLCKRLEMTADALGKTGADIHRETGIKANRWSQYLNPDLKRRITLDAATRLCDEYKLTLDWIYRGDPRGLPVGLLEKLAGKQVA